jgi:putative FmdB family regulatory protein
VPTYQYSCTECGHFFEAFQSFSDDSLTVCPECGGRLRKVFNAVGVVFKGSGFYRNDSRGQKAGAEAGSTSNGSGDSGKSGDSGTTKTSESTTSTAGTTSTSGTTSTPSPA